MDVKSNVRKRREERIRQLTAGDLAGQNPSRKAESFVYTSQERVDRNISGSSLQGASEPDPELLWKRGQGRWKEVDGLYSDDGGPGGKESSFWTMLFIRMVISALLFGAIWGINKYKPDWSFPARAFIAQSLTIEMDFTAAEAWYERTFGGPPSFIPIFKHNEEKGLKVGTFNGFHAPLSGSLAQPFAVSLKGVEIVPANDSDEGEQVKSVETGRVLSITRDALTGMTVMIQHGNGYVSIYGRLEELTVEKGDWVEGGDTLGSIFSQKDSAQSTLYFAMKKNDRYIDPVDVIPFD